MYKHISFLIISSFIISVFLCGCIIVGTKISDIGNSGNLSFPVIPEIFSEGVFSKCEGIAFNGEGKLFVAGDNAIWSFTPSGISAKIFTANSNLGLAPIGERDILFADFGPKNAFVHGYNRDGVVWRVSPDSQGVMVASNMGDPNFVTVFENGSFLVSDDATNEIHIINLNGNESIFTTKINHPNGMVLSLDGSELYIAQMFKKIKPYELDGRIWSIKLKDSTAYGEPQLIVDLGDNAANDGLAIDILGRIYVSCWNYGEIWRYDVEQEKLKLIAKNMPGVASLAFGRGEFDHKSIYATSTKTGKVWRVTVGIEGAMLYK